MTIAGLLTTAKSTAALALGLLCGTIVAISMATGASAAGQTANVMPGLIPDGDACAKWNWSGHTCWHDDEGGDYSALDLNAWDGGDSGSSVYWKHWGATWSAVVSVTFDDIQDQTTTNCTGVAVLVGTVGVDADFHYLHIEQQDVNNIEGSSSQSWYSVPGYVEGSAYLGDTDNGQPTGCAFQGTHLHQSGNNAATTDVYTNWNAPETGCGTYLCNWAQSEWMHQIRW